MTHIYPLSPCNSQPSHKMWMFSPRKKKERWVFLQKKKEKIMCENNWQHIIKTNENFGKMPKMC